MKANKIQHKFGNISQRLFKLAVCAAIVGAALPTWARNEWFTGKTIQGQTQPLSFVAKSVATNVTTVSAKAMTANAVVSGGYVDVVISLYSNPQTRSDRAVYEAIITNWADGMFEATEGAHKLRNVRIYTKGKNQDKADVVWVNSIWPSSPVSGITASGNGINFGDIFPGGEGAGHDHNMLADSVGAGYTLAHEWGHYAYGLYDEYKIDATDVPTAPSIMNSQWNAINGDFRWLNYSIANHGGGDFQDSAHTHQHNAYDTGCWPVLARSAISDPVSTQLHDLLFGRRRAYYPELASVAPTTTNTPNINLPAQRATARANLNIIWETDNLAIEIVIDRSGSMGTDNKMENAKTAAKLLVEQAGTSNAIVGVIDFDDTIETVYPPTQVTDVNVQTAIENAIDNIYARNSTAVYNAAETALNTLKNLQTTNDTKVVFLLTDGLDNSSSYSPSQVIQDFENAQVPLFTFGYGSDADVTTLQSLADQTGGKFFNSPTTLNDIAGAFSSAFVSASSVVGLNSGVQSATTASTGIPFTVDSSLATLNLTLTFTGNPSDVSVQLLDPNNNPISTKSIMQSGGDTIEFFTVASPTAGVWHLMTSSSSGTVSINYQVVGVPSSLSPVATLDSINGTTLGGNTPLILLANLGQGLGISGAGVSGTVKQPDGTLAQVQFKDDGNAPDGLAGDGIYTAQFNFTQKGQYTFTVHFDNDQGTATLSYAGRALTARTDGTGPSVIPSGGAVGYNFSRSASLSVNITSVATNTASILSQTLNASIDRQSGLFYQQVIVTNTGAVAVSGIRMSVTNLPAGVRCISATGTNSGIPYIDYTGSINPGQTLTLNLAYYSNNRQAPVGVGVSIQSVSLSPAISYSGTNVAVNRAYLRPDGKMAVEFNCTAGRSYVVEYSSDMVTWKQAQPPIVGNGSKMIWVDSGPPTTESAPNMGSRFYRLLLLP